MFAVAVYCASYSVDTTYERRGYDPFTLRLLAITMLIIGAVMVWGGLSSLIAYPLLYN